MHFASGKDLIVQTLKSVESKIKIRTLKQEETVGERQVRKAEERRERWVDIQQEISSTMKEFATKCHSVVHKRI